MTPKTPVAAPELGEGDGTATGPINWDATAHPYCRCGHARYMHNTELKRWDPPCTGCHPGLKPVCAGYEHAYDLRRGTVTRRENVA